MKPHLFLCLAIIASSALCNLAISQTIEVTSTGVGIGTASPGGRLDIFGADGGPGYLLLRSFSNTWWQAPRLGAYRYRNTQASPATVASGDELFSIETSARNAIGADTYVGGLGWYATGTISGSTVQSFFTISTNSGVSGAERFRIDPYGNVGIGTTSPARKLEVYSTTQNGHIAMTGSNVIGIRWQTTDINSGERNWEVLNNMDGQGTLSFRVGTSQTAAPSATKLAIDSSGNVGIGTTAPSYKLEVAGTVRATSFVSNSYTYADFVFKPGYKLASLSEVEAAIKTNGHLPDVPSEAEAKARGVDLAQMQVKLLQKVEEMTLYLVEHDKELQAQKKSVQQLQVENEALRRQLSALEKR